MTSCGIAGVSGGRFTEGAFIGFVFACMVSGFAVAIVFFAMFFSLFN
jgi:hypothetical protein